MRVMQVFMCALTILCVQVLVRAQKPRKPHQEEKSFSAEVKMKHPVSLPDDVLQMLRSDKEVQRVCLAQHLAPDHIEAVSFMASHINISDKRSPDLIVTSTENKSCYLGGANIDPFWLF